MQYVRRALCAASFLLAGVAAIAAEGDESRKGHGHVSVGLQLLHVDGFESNSGKSPIGTTDTQTLSFEVEYYATDRLTLVAGLPLIRKRYQGPGAHDPLALDPPRPEMEFVDDGDYHTDFQDWHFAVRYLLREGRFQIEPFIGLEEPASDYPFFAHAAVGQQLTKVDLGSNFSYRPPLSDAFYTLSVSRVFVEETLGVTVDHWRVNASAGYIFSDRFSARVFALLKDGDGLDAEDFPPPRTDERWRQHDRMIKHNYMNAGIGIEWLASEKIQVSAAAMTMVWAEQVHILEYGLIFSASWSF